MNKLNLIAVGLSVVAAVICFGCAALVDVTAARVGLGVAGMLSLVAAFLAKAPPIPIDEALAQQRQQAEAERQKLVDERHEFEEFLTETTRQLTDRARKLDGREVQLAHRLANFNEWLEFPQPNGEASGSAFNADHAERPLADLDHRVLDLINEEAQLLYTRLRQSHYKAEGKLDTKRIRDDLNNFVIRVARIYKPDSENPLLETSVDQLLRAGSRACLHMLVVLERLPLNLKDQTILTLYNYVQHAIKAYEVYAASQPYMGYVQTASYVGRLVAGASPLTVGLTWMLGELGKRGTKAAANWLIDQQAVGLLNEMVRVIGFEVASIYGGDFRHRDPNWVYGSELADLMSRFPLSRENLAQALGEIGGLSFRNEYDRVFLYRCVSAHREVRALAASHSVMTLAEREQVARRLERFFASFIHGKTPEKVTAWKTGVEERLGIKLILPGALTTTEQRAEIATHPADHVQIVRSLASFLISVKACPIPELHTCWEFADTIQQMDPSEREALLADIVADPPLSVVRPEIDVSHPIVATYINDLCRLTARVRPWFDLQDELVLETAVYLGQDLTKTRKQLDQYYSDTFASMLPKDAPGAKADVATVKAALRELQLDETILFAYPGGQINWPSETIRPTGDHQTGLFATSQRLLLVEVGERAALVAASPLTGLSIEKVDRRLIDECRLIGSQWTIPGFVTPQTVSVTMGGAVMTRYDTYFRPLLDLVRATHQ